ncbi:ZIP zinc/iron transport family [Laetiporus sulphureus 93-53]|uniref:ZIP zinc/iron transport family n=1 Tax=Laetiporus sulphureus 93-53 TaxID=1314785 RepID=A0A165EP43_9APHY|nr:ZIP zinc/iron transport family [Laetiporus sulphureus 93-53]KZT07469.1 ZIP zinc/iron transport family [Laetiporus sulphureus 93-53]
MRGHSIHRRDDAVNCGSGGGAETYTGLRIGSIFIIMATSMCAALFPVLARRMRWLRMCVPDMAFQIAKYFGSGVIIATAFIHLLDPAMDELGSECLSAAWQEYPYALAICLGSIFMIFIIEIAAFRWGTAVLSKAGFAYDAHGHGLATGANAAHGPEHRTATETTSEKDTINEVGAGDIEAFPKKHLEQHEHAHAHAVGNFSDSAIAQIIGVAILEFGVLLHSIFVGLTLAVNEEFKILFVVIVFHQTFEGLGVGSRLAYMELPQKYAYFPVLGGVLYGLTTPVGIAAGLGVRSSYNPDGTTASIVSGILDAFSAGILIYTGLVELMAHEFIFNKEMMDSSNRHLVFAIGCMMLGAGLMALLGKWA